MHKKSYFIWKPIPLYKSPGLRLLSVLALGVLCELQAAGCLYSHIKLTTAGPKSLLQGSLKHRQIFIGVALHYTKKYGNRYLHKILV